MHNVAADIRKYRKEADVTQAELGKRVGLDDSAISKIENQERIPTQQTLVAIANVFRSSLKWEQSEYVRILDGWKSHLQRKTSIANMPVFEKVRQINIKSVEDTLNNLGLERTSFVELLWEKLRNHQAMFLVSRDSTISVINLTVIGSFTWEPLRHSLRCNKLIRVCDDVDADYLQAWGQIIFAYNAMGRYSERYRVAEWPAESTPHILLIQAIEYYRTHYGNIERSVNQIVSAGIVKARISYEWGMNYLDEASSHLQYGEWDWTVVALEGALSAIHDLINTSMPETIGPRINL